MGKHEKPDQTPNTISDDKWAKILTAATSADDGDKWIEDRVSQSQKSRWS